MIKNIIREIPAEQADFSYYFDGDCFNENAGDFCNTLFILNCEYNRYSGLNSEVYTDIENEAERLIDEFSYVDDGCTDYDGNRITYKQVMIEFGFKYNSTDCHKLREWSKRNNTSYDGIAEYLSIKTGKRWNTTSASGYCQRDYVNIVYCESVYTEKDVIAHGEIYLGAGKEFSVIYLDDDGNEQDIISGYFVADSQAWKDNEYKEIICNWEGLKTEETALEMIDGYKIVTQYSYRTA